MTTFERDVRTLVTVYERDKVPVSQLVEEIGADWSEPGKMPCRSYNLPIWACEMGSKLRTVCGSVCEDCFAGKGRYLMPVVEQAMDRRLRAWRAHPAAWTAAQVVLMRRRGIDRFRWFDSGDLQGAEMYAAIRLIAEMCPQVAFWLPTKEYEVIAKYKGPIPNNLCVRVSHPKKEQRSTRVDCIVAMRPDVLTCSTVDMKQGLMCPASYAKEPELRTCSAHGCTACWERSVPVVDYKKH